MITGDLKNKIDKLWLEFWQGGIANPLTVIEQITFLMFARLLDINESRDEKRASRTADFRFTPRFKDNEQQIDDLLSIVESFGKQPIITTQIKPQEMTTNS